MNSNPKQNIQKSPRSSSEQVARPSKHGESFGFNPQAKTFVPGSQGLASGGRAESQRPEGSGSAGISGRRRETRGQRGRGEGGLSKALKHSKGRGADSGHKNVEQQTNLTAADVPPAPVLGRSPSRGHVSANHLLNFQQYQPQQRRSSSQRTGSQSSRRVSARREPYNANKFLQANFRFLVSDAADLGAHCRDADLMLDWGDVLEVEMLVPTELKCPITLESPPVCPQITPCGHVFSFPGIMAHLITHGGDALRKASPCPLCNALISARELRLVRAHVVPQAQVGKVIEFELLKRMRHEIIPLEVKQTGQERQTQGASPTRSGSEGNSKTKKGWQDRQESKDKGQESRINLKSLGYNHFAKFSPVKGANLLWAEAAEELAKYAAQVTEEGGLDAAQEAPYIFGAMDVLANRAAAWAERRQRILQDRDAPGAGRLSPHDAAQLAAQEVKKITNATVLSATEEVKSKAEEVSRLSDFPSLSIAPTTEVMITNSPAPTGEENLAPAATVERVYQSAFSDEDSPRPGTCTAIRSASGDHAAFQAHSAKSSSPEPSHIEGLNSARSGQQAGASGDSTGMLDSIAEETQSSDAKAGPTASEAGPEVEPQAATAGASEATAKQALPQPPPNEFFFYQAKGGQWVFLHPLIMRILLTHYESYENLPSKISGTLLELEPQTQTEMLRKRQKFLGHLPLGGLFHLAEIDLSGVLPAESVLPFAQDLKSRHIRRDRWAAEARRIAEEDTARMLALESAGRGPSAEELQAMPLVGGRLDTGRTESEDLSEAVALSLMHAGSSPPPPAPQDGISFAHMAKMGFAATGPMLPSSSPAGSSSVWGPRPGAAESPLGHSFPPRIASSPKTWSHALKSAEKDKDVASKGPEGAAHSKAKKGGKKLVLLGMQNRKY